MLRELTVQEVKNYPTDDFEVDKYLKEIAYLMESGRKIIVKEKYTAKGGCLNIYVYDANLYRYILSKSIDLNI